MPVADPKALKALAHHLKPVVLIGANGLTDAVRRETDLALKAHELIKVSVAGDDRKARASIGESLCESLECQLVQSIGKTLVLYRARPEPKPTNQPHVPKKKLAQSVARAAPRPGTLPTKPGARKAPAKKSGLTKIAPARERGTPVADPTDKWAPAKRRAAARPATRKPAAGGSRRKAHS